MLALTDGALVHLVLAAGRVSPKRRRRWLRDLAAKLDPPPQAPPTRSSSAAVRQARVRARKARHRARQRNGIRVFKLEASYDLVVGGLIDSGRISERDALDHDKVERVLSAMLTEWGQYWHQARS
jgi:hypothetical protein